MPMNKADAARQKLLSGLGLCAKARALIFGTPMVCESLREKNKPHLGFESFDTSAATHKKISDKCNFYQVQYVRLPVTGEELAAALVKTSTLAAVAVRDENLCRVVKAALDALNETTEQ